MRVGSLCTGYGGLDLAIGGETVFVSEIDKDANTVIDQRFPDVPNLGDFTLLDELPECDVLTAGFPCQPVSQAGKRAGTDDERWLWDDIERVVGGMGRPPAVLFLENVRGLLSANGGNAMGRVISGLARLGYVGRYRLISAASVGACHRRERVFIVARHADRMVGAAGRSFGGRPGTLAQPGTVERVERPDSDVASHAEGFGGWTGVQRRDTAERTQRRDQPTGGAGSIATHADGRRREGRQEQHGVPIERADRQGSGHADRSGVFGPYWPAVARWERIIGRPAPDPTTPHASQGGRRATQQDLQPGQPNASGSTRLNPRFVEWMMGLPDGWVTDTGVPRTAQLKILGNGVVPQQARAAWRQLTTKEATT